MKNVLIISDPHCGHKSGLTPPGYLPDKPAERRQEWVKNNRGYWSWWEQNIRAAGPFDIIILNGDAVDGKGAKSGGVEQVTMDMEEQCDMAIEIVRKIPKRKGCKIVMTRGTSYHVGLDEDWENVVADKLEAKIGEHEWVDIEGVVFYLKHHPAGSSGIPQGRHTGVAKDRLWNIMWNERQMQPKASIFIRSHVHYHNFCGGPDWLAITTPALQGIGSRFGSRRCSGIVDFGFITFKVNKGQYSWQAHIANIEAQKASVTKL